MASNFQITIHAINNPITMNLEGDFDATSAYEVIYAIKKLPEETAAVSIQTNDLNNVSPAGVDVFRRFMTDLYSRSRKILLAGTNASRLCPDTPRVASSPCRVTSWW